MLTDTNGFYIGIGCNMEWMLDTPGRAVFASGENSYPGAFTTYLFDYSEPIAFFGPGYHDMLTVVHEMGHYGAFSRHGMGAPIDFCEVHSQTNEWLFVAFLEDELSPEVHELIELSRLVEGLERIILSVAVDECEERLYTSGVQSVEDISSIVSEVTSLYGEDISEKLRLEKYFRLVAPENPAYYLNYAVSEIVSMGNYVDATEDLAKAQSDYDDFIFDSYDPEITKLGLRDAFEEETYEALIDTFSGEDGADNGDGEDTDGKTDGGTLVYLFDGELMPAA
jgi:hypothetical protein